MMVMKSAVSREVFILRKAHCGGARPAGHARSDIFGAGELAEDSPRSHAALAEHISALREGQAKSTGSPVDHLHIEFCCIDLVMQEELRILLVDSAVAVQIAHRWHGSNLRDSRHVPLVTAKAWKGPSCALIFGVLCQSSGTGGPPGVNAKSSAGDVQDRVRKEAGVLDGGHLD